MISHEDTIAAIATPLGEGGIGVVRVSGKAIEIVAGLFKSVIPGVDPGSTRMDPRFRGDDKLSKAPTHTCHVGYITAESVIDQVVVTLFRAPHSYTGEDVVEISAHGNPFTLQKILSLCVSKGARTAAPGEFTERAFLNGKIDLTQAEAVADLIRAKTDKTQAAALAQLQGRLADKVRSLRDKLLPLLAHVEVGLDHADDEHPFISQDKLAERCREVESEISDILASSRTSKILREGFRVAFLGRPNVGKSSLLNALLKEDRAIVTPIPGTTRDTLEESFNMEGIPVILTDTAGLRREAHDSVERLGMERTHKSVLEADAVIGLFDGSAPLTPEDEDVVRRATGKSHVWAINKSDLPQQLDADSLRALNGGAPVVRISAKTGVGLETLSRTIAELALREKAGASEAQWLLNARHQAALEKARLALQQAVASAQDTHYEECVALDLQTALGALGELIGETTTEELLGQIFSQFCVGK